MPLSQASADPGRTYALLVAVEKYAAPWDLPGPLGDVLDYHAWLLGRGVPAAQIHVLASPMDAHKTVARQAGVVTNPATSVEIRAALDVLRERKGDLLFVIWAGHGVVNEKQHRLFVADATVVDKRNFSLETLRESLASTYFAGFSRQIIIVDACANYQDWSFTVPSEPVPRGDPLPREQFLFFAAQPGQVAKTLGIESRGLFSRELLRKLHDLDAAGPDWPPDMRRVAEKVQGVFAGLRRSNRAAQTPIYEWSRDWEGNAVELSTAAAPGPAEAPPGPSWELSFVQAAGLTDALTVCKTMSLPQGRDDVLAQCRAAAIPSPM